MSFVNGKKSTETKSDFYLSMFRAQNELLVRYFEERDLSRENKLLIDKENELKRRCNKLKVIDDDKRNAFESRKLLFVYDERRLAAAAAADETGAGRMVTSKHFSRKQSILLEGFHAKNKVLVFRPIANVEHVPGYNRVKFRNEAVARDRYECFEKEMEILPILLDSGQPVDSLNKEVAYYMKSDRDGYAFVGGGPNPNDTFNLKIYLYELKIELDHKTRNNSIKHCVFSRKEECLSVNDETVEESRNASETTKRPRNESSKLSHTIRKMYMIQSRNREFPSEIEIIFKNYNVCYVSGASSKSRLEITYSLSEYDINNNKVDVNELTASVSVACDERKVTRTSKQKQTVANNESETSLRKPPVSQSTVLFDNRSELDTIRSEIEHSFEPEPLPVRPLPFSDKNFIEQNRKNVSKIPVLRAKKVYSNSTRSLSRPAASAPKRVPGPNNPMTMLMHAATLKNRDNPGKRAESVPVVDGRTVANETQPIKPPKEIIEVKLNAKNFFGEGFKDEVFKEMRNLANSIIESKKTKAIESAPAITNSRIPIKSASAVVATKKPQAAKQLSTASASKTSLPTVYEDTKTVTKSKITKPTLAKVNSFRSGSPRKPQRSASITTQNDVTGSETRPTTVKPVRVPTRPPPATRQLISAKIQNSRTSSSIELPKIKKIGSQINQKSYVSLRNLPVTESNRTKRISTLVATNINHKSATKSNLAKMSIDNLCCETNNNPVPIPIPKNDTTNEPLTITDTFGTSGSEKMTAAQKQIPDNKPIAKQFHDDEQQNESIGKFDVAAAVAVAARGHERAQTLNDMPSMRKKPHFLKKLIRLARKN